MTEILPSLLAADFARLDAQISSVERGGTRMLHLDVMDGHFVPNISFGQPVVQAIRKITKLKLDVHLMITDPDRFIGSFAEAGADQISVHQEACPHLNRTLRLIRSEGALAGVVLNPATPLAAIDEVIEVADFVLLMSVNPGFGGQQFIPQVLRKVRALDRKRQDLGLSLPIEIDGGVTRDNLPDIIRAGVDWVVAGSSVFGTADPGATVAEMQQVAREALAVGV